MMKKTLLPLFLFFAVSAYAQNTIEAKELKKGESLRREAKLSGVSLGTAQKVNKLATENGML